jgi:hypothetical protein
VADDVARSLALAKTYPYDIPRSSFAFAWGKVMPLVAVDLDSPLESVVADGSTRTTLRALAERRGTQCTELDDGCELVLAYGSNASVQGLSRKFSRDLERCLLPAARATLADFDIVYSAHISTYGAIPAAIQHCPGARTTVYVLLATPAQRHILRETEPNYLFAALDDLDLRLELGPSVSSVSAVLTRHGMLTAGGSEIGVAAVETQHRRFPAMTKGQALELVRDRVAPGVAIDEFILENVGDRDLASRRTEVIKSSARPFSYPSWRPLDV